MIGGLLGPIGAVAGGIIGGWAYVAEHKAECKRRAERISVLEGKIAYGLRSLREAKTISEQQKLREAIVAKLKSYEAAGGFFGSLPKNVQVEQRKYNI